MKKNLFAALLKKASKDTKFLHSLKKIVKVAQEDPDKPFSDICIQRLSLIYLVGMYALKYLAQEANQKKDFEIKEIAGFLRDILNILRKFLSMYSPDWMMRSPRYHDSGNLFPSRFGPVPMVLVDLIACLERFLKTKECYPIFIKLKELNKFYNSFKSFMDYKYPGWREALRASKFKF